MLKFIDLFAGLGGFHVGLDQLGMECVFASELNKDLQELYKRNFGLERVEGDIKKVDVETIPEHDFLCAGFPCQPFSKAGSQEGLKDEVRGNLFFNISDILERRQPKYLLLENVANLHKHDEGKTWTVIEAKLRALGYDVDAKILSPHQFDVPQHRQRIFIVGILESEGGLKSFNWPTPIPATRVLGDLLEDKPDNERKVKNGEEKALRIWQEFIDAIPDDVELPSFPIWTTEYQATYPFEDQTPGLASQHELAKFKGAFGESLEGLCKEEQMQLIPTYAHQSKAHPLRLFPSWKQDFIRQNREFLKKYEKELADVMVKIRTLPFSWQKFEWNCKGWDRNIEELIIQFRPSGIRVKRPNYSPALVSFTRTQVPAIGWKWRYMTPREAARLQSLGDIELPSAETTAFRALGNAVNAEVVKRIAERLIDHSTPAQIDEPAPKAKRKRTYPVAVQGSLALITTL